MKTFFSLKWYGMNNSHMKFFEKREDAEQYANELKLAAVKLSPSSSLYYEINEEEITEQP